MKYRWIFTICALFLLACYDFSLPKSDSISAGDGGTDTFVENANAGNGTDGVCGAGGLPCNNSCVANDKVNCGACGHDCTALPHVNGSIDCNNGVCVVGLSSCAPGWAHCSLNPDDGCETDLSKPTNCGICNNDCSLSSAGRLCAPKGEAAGASPASHECTATCPQHALTNCVNSCADLDTSPNNCGSCGNRCGEIARAQATCEAGACGMVCNSGSHYCADRCVADTSPDSCGTLCKPCDVPLNSIPSCDGIECSFECKEGYLLCDNECVPNDESNCGTCGNNCSALPNVSGKVSCIKGGCSVADSACTPGFAHCSTKPEDKCETDISKPDNCGSCGNKCPTSAPDCTLKPGSTTAKPIYECTKGCTTAAPDLCGTSCVNKNDNPMHCGVCNKTCAKPAGSGQAVCAKGKCGIKCNANYHESDGACVSNKSTDSCGDKGEPCPDPPNATATCDGESCGFSCTSSSYLKCQDTDKGCVTNDNENCGECGNDCTAKSKVCDGAGNCVACRSDSDCTNSSARYCVDNTCKACNPSKTNSCGVCKKCTAQGSCGNFEENTQDSAGCSGTCQACRSGKCSSAKSGTDPGNKCTESAQPPCTGDNCDSAGRCSVVSPVTCYKDSDGDGWGISSTTAEYCVSCPPNSGWVSNSGDCYDKISGGTAVNPDQKDYFANDRGDGSWDYDCKNGPEKFTDSSVFPVTQGCIQSGTQYAGCDEMSPSYDASALPGCGQKYYSICNESTCTPTQKTVLCH
jgi:hypothetical protein